MQHFSGTATYQPRTQLWSGQRWRSSATS
ncbi:hypothetical protein LINPERHAP1_LOCUS7148 [Linum perenne]